MSRANAIDPADMFNAPEACATTGASVSVSTYHAFDDRYASDFEAALGNRPRLVSIVGRVPHPSDAIVLAK